jgi:hypothetical protein
MLLVHEKEEEKDLHLDAKCPLIHSLFVWLVADG